MLRSEINKKIGGKFRLATSLPEFLITMAIIGFVASLTYGGLTRHANEQKNIVSIKKIYSVLSQVTLFVIKDRDSSIFWGLDQYSQNSSEKAFSYYKPYFRTIRVCSNDAGCWRYPSRYLDGRLYMRQSEYYNYMFTLADGMNVIINVYPKEVIKKDFGVNVDRPSIVFLVDVNGDAFPNTMGKDIFAFVLKKDVIVPGGMDNAYSCNVKGTGLTCTARIIRDGWRVGYF